MLQKLEIISEETEYLTCTDVAGNTVRVLKPLALRASSTVGKRMDGMKYETLTANRRKATQGGRAEIAGIWPEYRAGEHIYAAAIPTEDGIELLDTNTDARQWVSVEQMGDW